MIKYLKQYYDRNIRVTYSQIVVLKFCKLRINLNVKIKREVFKFRKIKFKCVRILKYLLAIPFII